METPMREAQKRRTGAGWRFMANHSRKTGEMAQTRLARFLQKTA
jgi:hypothetical protein